MTESDIQLSAGIDFSGAEKQVNDFVLSSKKKLADLLAPSAGPSSSSSTKGIDAQTSAMAKAEQATRRQSDAVQQAIRDQAALDSAMNRASAMMGRIDRQLGGNEALYRRNSEALNRYTAAVRQHGAGSLEATQALGQFKLAMTAMNSEISKQAGLLATLRRQHVETQASFGGLRGALGQLGNQSADLAIVLASGANAFSAIGVQAGQFLSMMGPTAALIGGVVTVVGVLASVLFNSAKAAEESGTAHTNYAKALETAKRYTDELNGASATRTAALDAEKRAIIAARQAIVDKAKADLIAAQAAQANAMTGGFGPEAALSANSHSLEVEGRIDKLKKLVSELTQLEAAYGVFNDGARGTSTALGGTGQSFQNAGNAVEEFRQKLRESITELGLEAKGQDLSSAAKLRARLEAEALTKAQAAGRSVLDAGTKALIDQAVALQTQIDKRQAAAQAATKLESAEERAAKAAKKHQEQQARALSDISFSTEATLDEAKAILQGTDARAAMADRIETETKLRKLQQDAQRNGITLNEAEARSLIETATAADRFKDAASFARNLVKEYATPAEKDAARLAELKRNYAEIAKAGVAIPTEIRTAFDRAQTDITAAMPLEEFPSDPIAQQQLESLLSEIL